MSEKKAMLEFILKLQSTGTDWGDKDVSMSKNENSSFIVTS